MKDYIQAEWMTTDEINEIAKEFLKHYHKSMQIPIPIEEIIEFDLEIDIIPIPGLKHDFTESNLDIDGFISSDFQSITID